MTLRFTVLGHGALAVEAAGKRLLVDPWLSGSCYWRSWWHYPPNDVRPEHLAPDVVYLSHHHFDHFHYPSMRRLGRGATVLVPRFAVDVMPGEVRSLGFDDVRELPHGEVTELAPDLRVASFQYGFDDSALVVQSGDVVLADLNDCKMRGAALQEVLDAFGPPTFLLKSHSWAQAYPVRYTADDRADLDLLSRESYVADFVEICRQARPRYAVPFASMVGFLHPETIEVNDAVVTPAEVAAGFDRDPVPGTECVVLVPGDGWDETAGFRRGDTDYYDPDQRQVWLAKLAAEAAPAVERAAAEEATRRVDPARFDAFFGEFLAALPRPAAGLLLPRPVVFEVESDEPTPFWSLDARRRTVTRTATPPVDAASVVRVPEGVLADAIDKKVVNLIHISLRLRVHLRPGGLDTDLAFWGLLAMWELGYLPVGRLRSRRLTSAVWRRRREILDVVGTRLFGRGSFAERMSGGLIAGVEP